MKAIEVKNVTMSFGDVKALNNVTTKFEENKIYGLLGRNGAGKSTMLNVITNRLFATQGNVTIDGESSAENDKAQGKIYLMSEADYYPKELKVKEIFRWTKEFYKNFDMQRALSLSSDFGLDLNKKIGKLSTGYSSIYKNIIALSLDIPYILLDEPVLGLDANHRELFYKKLIEIYSESPRTFVISTHLIEEVSKIIEHVIIIKNGEVVKDMEADKLLATGYTVTGTQKDVDQFISGKKVLGEDSLGGIKTAYIDGSLENVQIPDALELGRADMQKLFIELTNS